MRLPYFVLCISVLNIASVAAQGNGGNMTSSAPSLSPTNETVVNTPVTTATDTPSNVPTATLPTNLPMTAPVPMRSCYSDLVEVRDLVILKDPFVTETYIICPETVYVMGTIDTTGNLRGGFPPISPRSNSVYKCGEEGRSSNNCYITGGSFHVLTDLFSYGEENKVGIFFYGFTFGDSIEAALLLAAPGDIAFVDCIFENHQNIGTVNAIYSFEKTRRLLESYEAFNSATRTYLNQIVRSDWRQLQAAGDVKERQTITFDNCLFFNNTAAPIEENGIITVQGESNDVFLKSCIFQDNNFGTRTSNSWAISVSNSSTLNISNTCFIDNDFYGSGVVVVNLQRDFFEFNNSGTEDADVTCPFAFVEEGCVPFSSDVCAARETSMASSPSFLISGLLIQTLGILFVVLYL